MSEIGQSLRDALEELRVSDPSLAEVHARAATRRRRRRSVAGGSMAAAALVALLVANLILVSGDHVGRGAIAEAAGRVTLPGLPLVAESTSESMWVLSCKPCTPGGAGTLSRIDVDDLKIENLARFEDPASMAMSGGDLWIASAKDYVVYRVDPESGRTLASVKLPDVDAEGTDGRFIVSDMAGTDDGVWLTTPLGKAVLISAATETIEDQIEFPPKTGQSIAANTGGAWISAGVEGILHVAETGRRTVTPVLAADGKRLAVDDVVASGETVRVSGGWVIMMEKQAGPPVYVDSGDAGYAVVDAASGAVTRTALLPTGILNSTPDSADRETIWFSGQQSKTVVRSGKTGDTELSLDLPGLVVAAQGDSFWVARKDEMITKYALPE